MWLVYFVMAIAYPGVTGVNHDPFGRGIKEIDISPAGRLKTEKFNLVLYSDSLYVGIKIAS